MQKLQECFSESELLIKSFEKIKFKKKIEYTGEKFSPRDIFNTYSDILYRNENKINRKAKEIEKIAVYEKYTVQDKVKQIVGYLNKNNSEFKYTSASYEKDDNKDKE